MPLRVPPNLTEMVETCFKYDKRKVGWCLLWNNPIESEVTSSLEPTPIW